MAFAAKKEALRESGGNYEAGVLAARLGRLVPSRGLTDKSLHAQV